MPPAIEAEGPLAVRARGTGGKRQGLVVLAASLERFATQGKVPTLALERAGALGTEERQESSALLRGAQVHRHHGTSTARTRRAEEHVRAVVVMTQVDRLPLEIEDDAQMLFRLAFPVVGTAHPEELPMLRMREDSLQKDQLPTRACGRRKGQGPAPRELPRGSALVEVEVGLVTGRRGTCLTTRTPEGIEDPICWVASVLPGSTAKLHHPMALRAVGTGKWERDRASRHGDTSRSVIADG